MDLSAGSTINGFPILHEGTHDNKRDWHKIYDKNREILFIPIATKENQNFQLTYSQVSKSISKIEYYLEIEVRSIFNPENSCRVIFVYNKENNIETYNSKVIFKGRKRNAKLYKAENDNYIVFSVFIEVFPDEKLIAECTRYIYKNNGEDYKTIRDFEFLTRNKPLYGFPITSMTELNKCEIKKEYSEITFSQPLSSDTIVSCGTEQTLKEITMLGNGFYKLFLKIGIDVTTEDNHIVEVKIYKNDIEYYSHQILLSKVIKTINDLFYARQFDKDDILKITIKNLSSTTDIKLISTRTIIYLEQ